MRSFSDSAYRNLYLCVAPTVLLVSIALSLPLMAICQRSAIHWGHWAVGLAIGLSIGIFHFIIYGVSLSRTLNIASGVVGGVVSGNTTGVANASVLSVVLGAAPEWSINFLFKPEIGIYNLAFVSLFSLVLVIRKWQALIMEAGGEVGNLTKKKPSIKNPYVIGAPVIGDTFVGRNEMLRYIADEVLAGTQPCPSIVLYGHRRMGKTSLLKNLPARLKSTNKSPSTSEWWISACRY